MASPRLSHDAAASRDPPPASGQPQERAAARRPPRRRFLPAAPVARQQRGPRGTPSPPTGRTMGSLPSVATNALLSFCETASVADEIDARAADKVVDRLADRVADQVLRQIPPGFITKIAAQITRKLAAQDVAIVGDEAIAVADEIVVALSDQPLEEATSETGDNAALDTETNPRQNGSPRRSARQASHSAPAAAGGFKRESPETEDTQSRPAKRARTMGEAEPRRNPKRRASEPDRGYGTVAVPDNPLQEALRPPTAAEIEEWQGWAEVESEPAVFNAILEKLGVKDVKTRELLSCEMWEVDDLPHPVFGLVFLFQYAPHLEDGEEETDADAGQVWFANQTTSNSCASVALLNIVMNADDVELGPELQSFKESTRDLNSALRGHRIGSDGFIRTAHNSFVRRMDQLNADLYLAQEADDAAAKAARKRPAAAAKKGRKAAAARKKNKADTDFGFHFIAYVPAAGYVWELDGMRTKPRRIGPAASGKWTGVACPRIQQRIRQYGARQNAFNLLAICRSPQTALRDAIVADLAEMGHLRSLMAHDDEWAALASAVDADMPALPVADFGLTRSDILDASVPPARVADMAALALDGPAALHAYRGLATTVRAAVADYYREMGEAAGDERLAVESRRRDYTLAVHTWVKKLAEKGVLADIIAA